MALLEIEDKELLNLVVYQIKNFRKSQQSESSKFLGDPDPLRLILFVSLRNESPRDLNGYALLPLAFPSLSSALF